MLGGDAVEARHEFVDARVVLHRAGTQRIHAEVDRVVPGRKPREVAQDFDLAHFGKACDAVAAMIRCPERFAGSTAGTSSGGNSNARLPGEDFSKISPSF